MRLGEEVRVELSQLLQAYKAESPATIQADGLSSVIVVVDENYDCNCYLMLMTSIPPIDSLL